MDKLTRVVGLRLTEEDHAAFVAKVAASGMSQSEFLREAVLTNRTTVVARPLRTAFRERMLFLASKTSNNLNQLAHQVNASVATGRVPPGLHTALLAELRRIRSLFEHVADVD